MVDEWGIPIPKKVEDEKEIKKKKKNIFEIMNTCFNKRYFASKEDKKEVSEYLFLNLLSNHPGTIYIANFINLNTLPQDKVYDFVYYSIPKGVISYIPYPKKQKEIDNQTLDNICSYYKCNQEIGLQYLELLTEEQINKINNIYRKEGLQ